MGSATQQPMEEVAGRIGCVVPRGMCWKAHDEGA
jgi:hypothetical protein